MSKRVAIVGAGVLGAAIAWRLGQTGARVRLFDPTPGGLASPGSFAWLNASMPEDPVYNRLRHDSLELWRQMKDADPSVPIEFAGALLWEQEHFDLDSIADSHTELGRPYEWLDRETITAREPAVKQSPEKAYLAAGDGYGDPEEITGWFLEQAGAAGAELVEIDVDSIDVQGGRVTGLTTAGGHEPFDHVIVAAGTALPKLLAPLGVGIEMDNQPGLLARTSPGAGRISAMLAAPNVHVWQGADGSYLFGADFGGGSAIEDPREVAAAVLRELQALLKGTESCEIENITVRERPMPVDGRPAIGPLGPGGLYVVCTHSGMTLAPVIAEMVAREVGTGQDDPRLGSYRPDRDSLRLE